MNDARRLSPTRTDKTPIIPGVWTDAAGDIHFSVPELLAFFGWPDDDEHRAMCERTIEDVVRQQYPGVPITKQE